MHVAPFKVLDLNSTGAGTDAGAAGVVIVTVEGEGKNGGGS